MITATCLKARDIVSPSAIGFAGRPALRALLVGSDGDARKALEDLLYPEGWVCAHAVDDRAARATLEHSTFDLVILEGRFGGDGMLSLCRQLSQSRCPILVIGHGSDVIDRVLALEVGADDCLSSPYHEREVLARVKALVRRRRLHEGNGSDHAEEAEWSLDLLTRQLRGPSNMRPVTLTPQQQSLLAVFLKHPGELLTPEAAIRHDPLKMSRNHFRTGIVRLRRKLAAAGISRTAIKTLRSEGYMFDPGLAAVCRVR